MHTHDQIQLDIGARANHISFLLHARSTFCELQSSPVQRRLVPVQGRLRPAFLFFFFFSLASAAWLRAASKTESRANEPEKKDFCVAVRASDVTIEQGALSASA